MYRTNKVFMYWHSNNIPQEYQDTIQNNKKLCPDIDFVLFNHDTARNYIKSYYSADCLHAYDKLKPYAYKCDLWRLCILNNESGIYIDTKVKFTPKFKPWLKNLNLNNTDNPTKSGILLQDYHYGQESYTTPNNKLSKYPAIQNCFIISNKNNQFLLTTINQIITNTKNNYYGQSPLSVSGPGLLGKLYTQHNFNDFRILPLNYWQTLLNIHFEKKNRCTKQIHYHYMWHNKDIYNNI